MICCPDQVNAQTTVSFFDQLRAAYPDAPKIHIILDQSGYHRSHLVKDSALEKNIEPIFAALQPESQPDRTIMEGHE